TYGLNTYTITPAPLTVTANNVSPLCNSLPSYSSTVTGFQYSDAASSVISSGPVFTLNPPATGIPAGGSYQVIPGGVSLIAPANYTVSYANGTLTQPSVVTGATSATSTNCLSSTGTASVVASGGTPGYTYLWSPSNLTTATISNRPAGTYTVLITDSHGCTGSASATITGTGPNAPGTIAGPVSNLCNANGKNYSISPVPGATSYTWTVPAGANVTSNQGTSVTVTFGNGFNVA